MVALERELRLPQLLAATETIERPLAGPLHSAMPDMLDISTCATPANCIQWKNLLRTIAIANVETLLDIRNRDRA